MRFKVQYKRIKPQLHLTPDLNKNSYWATIDADDEPEANRIALRNARKGYRVIAMTQDIGYGA